jgi:hypothetical protein
MESLLREGRAESSVALRRELRAEYEFLCIFHSVEEWDNDPVSSRIKSPFEALSIFSYFKEN